jgi:hypothetical protein
MYSINNNGISKKRTLYTTHGARKNVKSAKAGGRAKVYQVEDFRPEDQIHNVRFTKADSPKG